MALNIKNSEVEQLAAEVAELADESKTSAILHALRERRERLLALRNRQRTLREMRDFLEREVWSLPDSPGATTMSDDELLGFELETR
jgi:antitoxin VapB